jgi:hypothetical protein
VQPVHRFDSSREFAGCLHRCAPGFAGKRRWKYLLPMPTNPHDEKTLEALIKMEVACRLALESLPNLPSGTEHALRRHIETLCEVTERELKRLQPAYTRVEALD